MKKLSFLISALAVTTLVGCGGGQKPTENKCYTSVYCNTGCYLENDPTQTKAENIEVTPNEEISFKVTVKDEYELHLNDFTVTVNDQTVTTGYTYAPDTTGGRFKVESQNVHDKLKILIKPESKKKTQTLRANCNEYCRIYKEDWTTTREINAEIETGKDYEIDLYVDKDEGYVLTKDNITVLIAGKVQTEDAFFYDSYTRQFILHGAYVQGRVQIIFEAKQVTPPVEKYSYVNYGIDNITKIDAPNRVKNGDSMYATFKANEKYRLPSLDTKGDVFQIKINQRLIHNITDYLYIIDENYIGHVYIFSEVIDDTVNIVGECIEQLNIILSPGDGKWEKTQESSTILSVIDKGKTLNDALTKADCGSPISNKKDEGYSFSKWTDKDGKEVFSAVALEKDTSVTANYELRKCYTYLDNFNNINLTETRKTINESYDFKSKIEGRLVANNGYLLPNEITVEVKEHSEYTPITGFTYTPSAKSPNANLIIPGELVTGDLRISGKCTAACEVTFSVGDGVWDLETKSKENKVGYCLSGETVLDAMHNASIYESAMPVKEDGQVFDSWYYEQVPVKYDETVNKDITLTAHYTTKTFEKDSWANISEYANYKDSSTGEHKGLEKLKEVYKPTLGTFIGMERDIKINAKDYKVRVIGENQDKYKDSEGKEVTAALTFEVTEIVELRQYTSPSSGGGNKFVDSDIRKYLNNDLYNTIDTNTIDIKEVSKKTLTGGKGDDFGEIKTSDEKLFMLSGSEMGINGEIPEEGSVPTRTYNYDEGDVYSYYYIYSDPSYRVKEFIKSETEKSANEYWLRSPHAVSYGGAKDSTNVYMVKENGHYNRQMSDLGTKAPGIVPAFAI